MRGTLESAARTEGEGVTACQIVRKSGAEAIVAEHLCRRTLMSETLELFKAEIDEEVAK